MSKPRKNFRREANACRIYGVCKEANWRLTVADIKKRTGIRHQTIRSIATERGWPIVGEDQKRQDAIAEPKPLDEVFA